MTYSLFIAIIIFFLYSIFGQRLSFKRKHRGVTNSRSLATYIENFASKVEAWGLLDGRKILRLRLCFWVVDDVTREESPEWIRESRCRHQVRVRLHVFAGVFDPYTLPRLQFMLGLHFTHSLRFTHGPQSAVRSPQSAFYTDRVNNTCSSSIAGKKCM